MSSAPQSPFGSVAGDAPGDADPFASFADEFEDELPRFNLGDLGEAEGSPYDPEMLKLKAQMMAAEYYIKAANVAHEARMQAERYAAQGQQVIRERPLEAVAGAFVVGAALAGVLRRL